MAHALVAWTAHIPARPSARSVDCTHMHTHAHARTRVHTGPAWVARTQAHASSLPGQRARAFLPLPGTGAPGREPAGKAPAAPVPPSLRHAAAAALSAAPRSAGTGSPRDRQQLLCHRCSPWHACRYPQSAQPWGWLSGPPGEPGPRPLLWGFGHGQSHGWEAQLGPRKGCVPPSSGAGADPCQCLEPWQRVAAGATGVATGARVAGPASPVEGSGR